MRLFLTALSGIAWTIVYIDAVRIGFKHKTYAMPIVALALNIAWETIYAVLVLQAGIWLQGGINVCWALLDLVIVYTFARFGRAELPALVTRPLFIAWAALVFISAYVIQGMFIVQFGWIAAGRYSAFLQNLLMSGLFITMFVARGGHRGQTLLIAVAKWVGTLAPTIVFGVYDNLPLILALGILCSMFDLAYIGLLIGVRPQPATPKARSGRGVKAGRAARRHGGTAVWLRVTPGCARARSSQGGGARARGGDRSGSLPARGAGAGCAPAANRQRPGRRGAAGAQCSTRLRPEAHGVAA